VNKNGEDEDDDDGDMTREYVKWIASDHPRPCVFLQESPFFSQIYLSVSDWNFHLWKLGEEKPLFVSPMSSTYLTAGAWSSTRPAVLYVATDDGQILAWDFTDSSFRPSIELKATHSKITSLEFLPSQNRYQLMAVGDEDGTLHIFEVPRNLTKTVHKEEQNMLKFLDREMHRIECAKNSLLQTTSSPDTNLFELENMNLNNRVNTTNSEYRSSSATNNETKNDNNNTTNNNNNFLNATNGTTEEQLKLEKLVLSKEEEDFLKLEMSFISELGLTEEQVPKSFINNTSLKHVSSSNSLNSGLAVKK